MSPIFAIVLLSPALFLFGLISTLFTPPVFYPVLQVADRPEVTAAILGSLAGAGISLIFSVICLYPKIKIWRDSLTEDQTRLIMILALVVTAIGIFSGNCYGWFIRWLPAVSCNQAGVETLAVTLIFAIMGNQSIYSLTFRGKLASQKKVAKVYNLLKSADVLPNHKDYKLSGDQLKQIALQIAALQNPVEPTGTPPDATPKSGEFTPGPDPDFLP